MGAFDWQTSDSPKKPVQIEKHKWLYHKIDREKKQEVHRPHCSSEKPVQINEHIGAKLWNISKHWLIGEEKPLSLSWELNGPYCKTLSLLHLKMLFDKFGWNWLSGFEEDF